MKEGNSFNLFSPDAHSSKKPKAPPPKKAEEAKQEVSPKEDAFKVLANMKKMHEELNVKIDNLFKQSGRDPREIREYFKEPRNFTAHEWKRIQDRKEELEAYIKVVSKEELKKKKSKQKTSEMSKERKGKTLGARKKWLPMR